MPALSDLQSFIALPLAALLGAALAFRPRRRGTPPRVPAVIQTQVILAVVGALVMLVVGASMARAFGIVGAASLIRYRAKISDPKDAGVMLCSLGVGLASGVGLHMLATTATLFLLLVLYVVESLERPTFALFELTVGAKSMNAVRPGLEHLLSRHHARAQLRHLAPDEVTYTVHLPINARVDVLSDRIVRLDPAAGLTVEWDEKKVRA